MDLPTELERFRTDLQSLGKRSSYARYFEGTIHGRLLTEPDYFTKLASWNEDLFCACSGSGKVVVDYGSGFGLTTFFIAAFGAKQTIGIEIDQQRIKIARSIKDNYFRRFDIQFRNVNQLGIPRNSVDAILFVNVLSHVKIPIRLLGWATDALRYGGKVVVQDNNNSLTPIVQIRNRRLWKRNDRGQMCLRREMFTGALAGNPEKYARMSPGLDREDVELLLSTSSHSDIDRYLLQRRKDVPTFYIERGWVDEKNVESLRICECAGRFGLRVHQPATNLFQSAVAFGQVVAICVPVHEGVASGVAGF